MDWYNDEHLHSAVGYVTPSDRHAGQDVNRLAQRRKVYEEAKRRHPERWSGATRNWDRVELVKLNPVAETTHTLTRAAMPRRDHMSGDNNLDAHRARPRADLC